MKKKQDLEKRKLENKIESLKENRLTWATLAITFGLFCIVFLVMVNTHYTKLEDCKLELDLSKKASYFFCNNFNLMANHSAMLVKSYINESFEYSRLPDCEAIK